MTGFELDKPKKVGGVNLHAKSDCVVCSGDKLVVVGIRPAKQTAWMEARKLVPASNEGFEEYAPCPACNAGVDTEFYRFDGTKARALDAAKVRELMRT